MANEQNLKPCEYTLSREQAKKGGINSGKSRRERGDMRKSAQAILDGKYKDKDGNIKKGSDILVLNLFEMASNPKHKQSINATKLLMELAGQDRSEEDIAKLKAEISLLESKARMFDVGSSSVEDLTALAEMLKDDGKETDD